MTITQEPQGIYPAYNDSYIKFTSAFTTDDRAVLVVDNQYQFTIFPNNNGEYLFNLKHIITALINEQKFSDDLDISNTEWGYSDSSLYSEIDLDITAYGDDTTENVLRTYKFSKSVKQFGDKEYSNDYQLMLPSEDGINYHLTYFEGFPLDIPFRYLRLSDDLSLTNSNTQVSKSLSITSDNPYRLFIDKGDVNWAIEDYIHLPDLLNNIQFSESGVLKTSLYLKKNAARCGTYIKWVNPEGGYSYWLFNDWFKEGFEGDEIDRVSTNNFSNIYSNKQGTTQITGKSGGRSIELKTLVTKEEKEHIKSLFTSPRVWLYTSKQPFVIGEWLDVKVITNGFSFNSKKYKNQIKVELELPEVQTQTL